MKLLINPHTLRGLFFLIVVLTLSGCHSVHYSIKDPRPSPQNPHPCKFYVNSLAVGPRRVGNTNFHEINTEKAKSSLVNERRDMFTNTRHGSIPIDIYFTPGHRKGAESYSLTVLLFLVTAFQFPMVSDEERPFTISCKLGDGATRTGSVIVERTSFASCFPSYIAWGILSAMAGFTPFVDGHFQYPFEGNKEFADAVANVIQQFDRPTVMREYNRLYGKPFELKPTEN